MLLGGEGHAHVAQVVGQVILIFHGAVGVGQNASLLVLEEAQGVIFIEVAVAVVCFLLEGAVSGIGKTYKID